MSILLARSKMLHLYPLSLSEKNIKSRMAPIKRPCSCCHLPLCSLLPSQPVATTILHGCSHSCWSGNLLCSVQRTCFSSCWPTLTAERQLTCWLTTWILHWIIYPHFLCLRWATGLTNLYIMLVWPCVFNFTSCYKIVFLSMKTNYINYK